MARFRVFASSEQLGAGLAVTVRRAGDSARRTQRNDSMSPFTLILLVAWAVVARF